jgi:hypothetical protein
MTLVNASALDTSPPEFLIEGVIPRVGFGIWWGPSHIGKSLVVANEMALAVANGTPFFGRQVIQGNVVLALGEGTYDAGVRMQARIAREDRDRQQRIREIAGADGDQAAIGYELALLPYTDRRVFVETSPFIVPVGRGNLISPSLINAVNGFAQIPDLEMVILDALPDFSGGESITNDTMATRFVMGLKYMVAALDCALICVHHATAKGDKMIGGIRLFNAADFVAHLAADQTAPDEPDAATITCEKNKYGERFEPAGYTVEKHEWWEPERDEDGELTGGDPVRVTSASVRLRSGSDASGNKTSTSALVIPPAPGEPDDEPASPGRPRLALPDIQDVVQRRPKRSGLRTVAPAVIPDPGPDAAERAALIAALVSGSCPDCDDGRPGGSCSPGSGGDYVVLGKNPLIIAHTSRLDEAVTAGAVSLDDVLAQFQPGQAPAVLTGGKR